MQATRKVKTARDKAELIAELAANKKGQDIVLMDMRGISDVCDWFVLVSARSAPAIKAILREIEKGLSREKISPVHIEGRNNPFWVLMDYGEVVVHIFNKETRQFYGLERVWSDSTRENFEERCLEKTFQKRSQKPS